MSRSVTTALIALMVLACVPVLSLADVNVGDRPTLVFNSANGMGTVNLEKLKGKMVIVDFWATWCGPCMAEADHMVQVNTSYAPKGLQMIGISLDQDKPSMIRVAQEKGFAWPQYFDGRVWQNQIGRQWGINSIPATFVIGPDGDVLWKGHPANLDNALAAAFKNHPPRLVDEKVLADANALADKIDAALKENGQASAIKLLAAVPADAKKDGKFAERMADIEKQLGEYATKSLAEIDPLIQDKKYVEAASRLSDLTKALGALPAGSDAKKKLSELMSNPEAKAQFEAAQKKKAADDELAVAKRMQGEGKDDQAYLRFKAVATNFAGTPAADEAKGLMAAYEQKNPGVVAKANEAAAAGKANAALGMAANYARAGRVDLAKRKYQEVIAAYPNTSYAQKAQAAIAELEGKGK